MKLSAQAPHDLFGLLMATHEVGQLYNGRSSWPEAWVYSFHSGRHELVMFSPAPTEREIADVRQGRCEFALFQRGPVIMLCGRFGTQSWCDAAYSWHLVPEAQRGLPQDEKHALLHVLLVDTCSGILRAQRLVTFSSAFTDCLHRAIREQAALPWHRGHYNLALQRLQGQLPSETVAELATAHCRGGEPLVVAAIS